MTRGRAGHGAAQDYTLRDLRPGDIGWIIHRHGVVYAAEQGWDERFEALVARVLADFGSGHDPEREHCWIAERGGRFLGCVFLTAGEGDEARLRMLLVEPEARGTGLGTRLVAECVAFARAAGYARLGLWTNDVLRPARRLYQRAGFRLVRSEPHDLFGDGLVGEHWELALPPRTRERS